MAREPTSEPVPIPTFREAADAVAEMRPSTWQSRQVQHWRQSLANHVDPFVGDKKVNQITTANVAEVVEKLWAQEPQTARMILQRMTTIFEYAIVMKWLAHNPADKALTAVLPTSEKKVKRQTTVDYREVASVLSSVRQSKASLTTRLAFEFMVLTAARTGEVRLAQWDEMNLNNRVRDIPADRMKTARQHRVHLSDRSMEILTQARGLTDGTGLVFPSELSVKRGIPAPMSNAVFAKLMGNLGIPGVPHGFRSSFWNWVQEHQPELYIQAQLLLGHRRVTDVQMAFMRFEVLEGQRTLLQNWAAFLEAGDSPAL